MKKLWIVLSVLLMTSALPAQKISDLPALTDAAASDAIVLLDASASTVKTITANNLYKSYYVTAYEVDNTGVADATTAVEAAIADAVAVGGGVVYFPAGTYTMNVTIDEVSTWTNGEMVTLRGAGASCTTLTSYDGSSAIIDISGQNNWVWPFTVDGFYFNGEDKTPDGIYLSTTDSGASSNINVINCVFQKCDHGIHNRGYWYRLRTQNCGFRDNNIGIGVYEPSGCTHGNIGLILNCYGVANDLAGIFIDGKGHYQIRDGAWETNEGPAVLFLDCGSTDINPNVIENVDFEGNGSSGSVTIDSNSYTLDGCEVYVDNSSVWISRMQYPDAKVVNASTVTCSEVCFGNSISGSVDSTSLLLALEGCTYRRASGSSQEQASIYMPGGYQILDDDGDINTFGSALLASRTAVTSRIAWERTNLIDNGSCAQKFTPDNLNGMTLTFPTDESPPIWGTCAKLELAAEQGSGDGVQDFWPGNISITDDDWILFTVDLKASGADGEVSILGYTGSAYVAYLPKVPIVQTQWRRYVYMHQASASVSITSWLIWNEGATDPDVLIANAQLLVFDSYQELIEYARECKVAPDPTIQQPLNGLGQTQTAIVDLTSAEVKALAASPKELVPAQGAGTLIEFISAILVLDYGGNNAFTETDDNLAIEYDSGGDAAASQTIEMTGFIDQAADTITNALPKIDAIDAAADIVNKNLALVNNNDEIAGNAANDNTLRVIVNYRVHTSLGL